MNFNINDSPVLVAPRPVRIANPYQHFGRPTQLRLVSAPVEQKDQFRLNADIDNNDDQGFPARIDSSACSDRDLASPRASPRSSLPSEALEEFLSILRPAIFPPSSPILRARRNGMNSLPTFGYPYKPRNKIEILHHKGDQIAEELDRVRSTPLRSPEPMQEHEKLEELENYDPDQHPRYYTSIALASPISRMHTRNPFQRQPSYEVALTSFISSSRSSPSVASTPISPATVPLPLPTTDEML
ncbi:hypothetical protein SERLA73DRAFT_185611 [Serpula lacrymans var. lacrymans S7.3]|uniref:Uncharacterized protein n=2 Tax=Serpula lacrymans var. lacrymans TaxID=341189 RepID=F8Q641_SERL3|nr:uncharacterized protein SERLADRAFT_474177 [Serpula lacrymans var. lacrymans S7.9]EGN96079.1 hypothetical protein SERLA73DRAFT_185611 [Serpula lacrymans var. lacrymans S7.3]EGO21600.1 hypothetical protein SERLADRAFT_474177 [Serpula lacrymans var. lacrymans S7.9]